jgi:hypothetical protein
MRNQGIEPSAECGRPSAECGVQKAECRRQSAAGGIAEREITVGECSAHAFRPEHVLRVPVCKNLVWLKAHG